MPRVREMQGVPAHLETLKTEGKRRHPARCIFAEKSGGVRICTCPHHSLYYKQCSSAKQCDYYEEK